MSTFFVGRKNEIKKFETMLRDESSKLVIVSGQSGMGKTELLKRLVSIANANPDYQCFSFLLEPTRDMAFDSILESFMKYSFYAEGLDKRSFNQTPYRKSQWETLFKVLVPKGRDILDLMKALAHNPKQTTRDQFVGHLNTLSKLLPKNGRIIFVIDPSKYLNEQSGNSFGWLSRVIPNKILFLIAQRSDDILLSEETLVDNKAVVYLTENGINPLHEDEVEYFVSMSITHNEVDVGEAQKYIKKFNGHPYAVAGAISLLNADGCLDKLPKDPTPINIAKRQWDKVCELDKENANKVFEALALLEVPVPFNVLMIVANVNRIQLTNVLAVPYLKSLLIDLDDCYNIYHSLLSDHIINLIPHEEAQNIHLRSIDVYRTMVSDSKGKNILALTRLPHHEQIANGDSAFVNALANECAFPMKLLGYYDTTYDYCLKALGVCEKDSLEMARLHSICGRILDDRGDYQEALKHSEEALRIFTSLSDLHGAVSEMTNIGNVEMGLRNYDRAEKTFNDILKMSLDMLDLGSVSNCYGNLGLIYRETGRLEKAEEYHSKALHVDIQLDRKHGIASQSSNLGLIYSERGDYEKAIEMHTKALTIEEIEKNKLGTARQLLNLGSCYLHLNIIEKAEKCLKQAKKQNEEMGRKPGIIKACSNLAKLYTKVNKYDEAETEYLYAYEVACELNDEILQAQCLKALGSNHSDKKQYSEAIDNYEKAKRMFLKLESSKEVAGLCVLLSNIHIAQEDYNKAEPLLLEALNLNHKLKDNMGTGYVSFLLAHIYFIQGNKEKSKEYINIAYKCAENEKDLHYKWNMYNNVADMMCINGNIDIAIYLYNRVIEICKITKNPKECIAVMRKLFQSYHRNGDYDKAITVIKGLLEFDKNFVSDSERAILYRELGSIAGERYFTNKDLVLSLQSHESSLKIHEKLGDKDNTAYDYYNMSIVLSLKSENEKALEFAKNALTIRQESDNKKLIALSYFQVASIYQVLKDIENAKKNYTKARQFSESENIPEFIQKVNTILAEMDKKKGSKRLSASSR